MVYLYLPNANTIRRFPREIEKRFWEWAPSVDAGDRHGMLDHYLTMFCDAVLQDDPRFQSPQSLNSKTCRVRRQVLRHEMMCRLDMWRRHQAEMAHCNAMSMPSFHILRSSSSQPASASVVGEMMTPFSLQLGPHPSSDAPVDQAPVLFDAGHSTLSPAAGPSGTGSLPHNPHLRCAIAESNETLISSMIGWVVGAGAPAAAGVNSTVAWILEYRADLQASHVASGCAECSRGDNTA